MQNHKLLSINKKDYINMKQVNRKTNEDFNDWAADINKFNFKKLLYFYFEIVYS